MLGALAGAMAANAEESADTLASHTLEEVVVTGLSARQRVSSASLGSENLELSRLAMTPRLFGENDIIKSMTLLPGVHSEAEGAGGFEIRGGNAYQNLVTMDGMTLYNPSHLMGVFSTFNDDAISHATLHKGPVPACLGGASSSALETFMKPGDMNRHDFSATAGILNAKLSASGPIVKNRLSFAVAARRSYVDLFLKLIPRYRKTIMNFGDLNAKLRYRIDSDNCIDGSFFFSRDHLALSGLMSMRWGNIAGSVNWNSRCGDQWSFVTTGAATAYSADMWMNIMDANQQMKEYIHNFSVNHRAMYRPGDDRRLEFGLRSELLRVNSGDMIVADTRQRDVRSGWQNALWAAFEGDLSGRLSLSAGLRLSVYSSLSGSCFNSFVASSEDMPDLSSKTYVDLEPRASMKLTLTDCHSIRAGASVSTQNIHGIRATTSTFPFDRYALSSASVRPERSLLCSAGYSGMTPDGAWDWSAEAYFRSMKNVYDYKDGMSMFSRVDLESIILGGRGRSYGMELMIRKNTGRLNGWISYTLSKTRTRIPGINGGRWYSASNDRRHDIAVVAIFSPASPWNFSTSWTFSSGRPLTAPDAKYEIAGTTCYYYSGRNTYKTPASHRLDLSATYTRRGRKTTSIWSFGIYNAYSYQSPFVIYFEDDSSRPSGTRAVQQSLFGILPSVSYTIKF